MSVLSYRISGRCMRCQYKWSYKYVCSPTDHRWMHLTQPPGSKESVGLPRSYTPSFQHIGWNLLKFMSANHFQESSIIRARLRIDSFQVLKYKNKTKRSTRINSIGVLIDFEFVEIGCSIRKQSSFVRSFVGLYDFRDFISSRGR